MLLWQPLMRRAGLLWPVIIAAAPHQLEVLSDSLTLFILDYLLLHPQTIGFTTFTVLRGSSTRGQEKRQTMNHPQSVLTNVLHPSVELTAKNGLRVMLFIKSLFDAFHIWMTLGCGFMKNITQPAISPSVISS